MQDRPADGDSYFSMHREVLTSVALIQQTNDTKICVEMQKNMFFSNHVFYAKKKCFLSKKTVF